MMRHFDLRRTAILLAAIGASTAVAGCGRTLVFAERDGINLAVRADATSSPPIQANFGLNRTVGTIVPPAGQKKDGTPVGEAVSMFAGFQVDNTVNVSKAIDADLTIDTQFASGKAAVNVASNPKAVAQIVNIRSGTFATSDSAKQFRAWLLPNNVLSTNRNAKLQEWLKNRYPTKEVFPGDLLTDVPGEDYEDARVAALRELKDVPQ
jgi:hypothetical protein